jgi:hypothetical protein
MFLLSEFHFDFFHFLAYALVGAHSEALAQHFDAEDEEENRGGEVCEAFGD